MGLGILGHENQGLRLEDIYILGAWSDLTRILIYLRQNIVGVLFGL